jgi:hypothetical protein
MKALVWNQIEALLNRYDGGLKIDIASLCCWGGELRLTLTNPDNAPARSIVFFSTNGNSPADVAQSLLSDAEKWLATSGIEPLPPPSLKKEAV